MSGVCMVWHTDVLSFVVAVVAAHSRKVCYACCWGLRCCRSDFVHRVCQRQLRHPSLTKDDAQKNKIKMYFSAVRNANVYCANSTCTVHLPQILNLLFFFMQTFIINTLLEKLPEFMFDGSVFNMCLLYSISTILHTFCCCLIFVNVILFCPSQYWRRRAQYSSHNY